MESWGTATPEGTQEEADKNVFTSLTVPTREGYKFDGWYAYAAVDAAGVITNLDPDSQVSVDVQYVDVNNKFNLYTETVSTQAVRITDGSGAIVYDGAFTLPFSGQTLFEGNGSRLKFYDALDRLTLFAKWVPDESKVTIVYWTENAQDKGYVPSNNVEDTYSATRAMISSSP